MRKNCDLQLNRLQLAPKCSAISTKMQCVLHQNAVQLAPKRSTFCTKTQGILHQNARRYVLIYIVCRGKNVLLGSKMGAEYGQKGTFKRGFWCLKAGCWA